MCEPNAPTLCLITAEWPTPDCLPRREADPGYLAKAAPPLQNIRGLATYILVNSICLRTRGPQEVESFVSMSFKGSIKLVFLVHGGK